MGVTEYMKLYKTEEELTRINDCIEDYKQKYDMRPIITNIFHQLDNGDKTIDEVDTTGIVIKEDGSITIDERYLCFDFLTTHIKVCNNGNTYIIVKFTGSPGSFLDHSTHIGFEWCLFEEDEYEVLEIYKTNETEYEW